MGRKIHTGKFATRHELEEEVRRLQKTGMTHGQIGNRCGISEGLACQIRNKQIEEGVLWQGIHHAAKEIKRHGNEGNVHARKDPSKRSDSHLHLRVRESDKALWEECARREGIPLSVWVVGCLNAAAEEPK